MALTVEPINSRIGGYVHVDAADEVLENGNPQVILEALNKHMVLVFPQVNMSDDTFLELSGAMGQMHDATVTDDGSTKKGIYRIALDKEDPSQLDFVKGNDWWHMDGTAYATPNKATMLKCESAPATGGDTGFANLFAAYEALPESRKDEIEDLHVMHCLASVGRKIYEQPTEEQLTRWNRIFPPRKQPMVWHQKDGRTSMVIGSTAERVVEKPGEEGEKLLQELLDWSTQDQFTYRHQWQKGDLVMFNNPGLLHRSYPYNEAAHRVMHRTTIKGTEEIA